MSVTRNCFAQILASFLILQFTWKDIHALKTIWRDDFDGPPATLPSLTKWKIDIGTSYPGGPPNWGTQEIQTYTENTDNLSLDGSGNLKITPLRDSSGRWTSARIETLQDDFKPPPGGKLVIEGRIQMPDVTGEAALGYWPAFWTLGAPLRHDFYSWPRIGEFDILENVNGLNKVWGALHCGVSPGGPCNETEGLGNNVQCPGAPCQSDFHTYRVEWDDGLKELRWFVDNTLFHRINRNQIGYDTWAKMTDHGYFVLLNVAIGGTFPNRISQRETPTEATVPGHPMLVDYVAVSIE